MRGGRVRIAPGTLQGLVQLPLVMRTYRRYTTAALARSHSHHREIVDALRATLGATGDLAGKRVLVTAGGTQEAIDPVRYIGNHSSGKMGYAIAERAVARGAEVTLVSGPVHLSAARGVTPGSTTGSSGSALGASSTRPEAISSGVSGRNTAPLTTWARAADGSPGTGRRARRASSQATRARESRRSNR